jgi:predicted DNA-binding transcriptional regulator AlpA
MTRNAMQAEPLWTIEDVATYLRVPVQTLYQWRHKSMGPPSKKCGRHLRYDPAAVRAWVMSDAA